MPAYAYPINIDYNRKTIVEEFYHTLDDGLMTLEDLRKIVGNNKFSIEAGGEENVVMQSVILYVRKEREETDAEYDARIRSEEDYMQEYKERQVMKSS